MLVLVILVVLLMDFGLNVMDKLTNKTKDTVGDPIKTVISDGTTYLVYRRAAGNGYVYVRLQE